MAKSKLLGIDFGSKRVGVAISDDRRTMAFPKYVLQNDGSLPEKIEKICRDEEIKEVVVGQSLNYKKEPNLIMNKITDFVKNLETQKKLIVHLEDEFLTSAEARRIQGDTELLDASAAALILKSFLERDDK
ncbi:Holliday junction resolvase RuvX [Candidatus Campbellbacteria bacterium CG11_big_fil_rev_8_21_14_0_20_44_21]|uniref:Putative pre-16S rRNA nuclease n=1 Tax=Candidatus Campbellbacteria bacterium CG22_combo_CG10-13_8_21_14_all_43_18 TaxID=1974530 RepID=A0A2H0DWT7_9BACT|nr:MAG: Holliday junction resolvase RuvX [Candidatus Campbellbacteria bacterium CG22_combo_CG10-13_8_21_14_all_43_18]PIR24547.1 MAG: Holliday junction resolvase RuvX [Candidatus Campbellbacteria bacterium CG11_big_fil_rev_8_21_14_0_20_44_21]